MLSDCCHEFLSTIATATEKLRADVEHYAEPPFSYDCIPELRDACDAVLSSGSVAPWEPSAILSLVALAHTTLRDLDTPLWDD